MEKKILEIMTSVFQTEAVNENCSQRTCEAWDSVNHLNLIIELEMEFGISFEPEEISNMKSYNEVLSVVKNKLS